MKRLRLLLDECIGCGNCTSHCPRRLATVKRGRVFIREGCDACGQCVAACGYYAIRLEDVPEAADVPN
jgi:ferredoxin